jgi:CRP-like cAMP-binding protein
MDKKRSLNSIAAWRLSAEQVRSPVQPLRDFSARRISILELARPLRPELSRPRNLILSQIPEEQFRLLSRWLVPVELPQGMQLSTPNELVDHIYFPVSGLISVDALTDHGESVEVGVVGREGLAGVSAVIGHAQMGHSVIMQGPGSGFRIRASVVREEFLKGGRFAQLIHDFIYLQMVQMSQSVLCNRLHPVEARMSRWLLAAGDRMQSDSLTLTQEFLAQMLGSRRATVTVAAGQLQRNRLIDYTRGRIKIVDRAGLETKACECYHLVRSKYDKVIGRNY